MKTPVLYHECWKSVSGISPTLSPKVFQSYIVLLSSWPTRVQLLGNTFTPVWGSHLTHLHLCHPPSSPPLGHAGFLPTLGICHAFIQSLNKSSLSSCQGHGSVLGTGDTAMNKTNPYTQELPLQENRRGNTNSATNSSLRRSVLGVHWKNWCWSWNSNTWPPDAKSWLICKDPDAGKDWRQEEKVMTKD